MIFVLIYKFSNKQFKLSSLFIWLGILEIGLEFWVLFIFLLYIILKIIF